MFGIINQRRWMLQQKQKQQKQVIISNTLTRRKVRIVPSIRRRCYVVLVLVLLVVGILLTGSIRSDIADYYYNDWSHLTSFRNSHIDSSTLSFHSVVDRNSIHNNHNTNQHRVAGLSCIVHGGPTSRMALEEMIYWYNIPSDTNHYSRSNNNRNKKKNKYQEQQPQPQYLTFEPDEGGWNNVRMALETTMAMAISMRRTLVLPPSMTYYLLWSNNNNNNNDSKLRTNRNNSTKTTNTNQMTFHDFYHLQSIQDEYSHVVQIITMEEFLFREGMTGQLYSRSRSSSRHGDTDNGPSPRRPPHNRTNWSTDGIGATSTTMYNFATKKDGNELWEYIRDVTQPLSWDSETCVAVFPDDVYQYDTAETNQQQEEEERLLQYLQQILQNDPIKYGNTKNPSPNRGKTHYSSRTRQRQQQQQQQRLYQIRQESYRNNPTPVNATPIERLAEILGHRKQLCIYNNNRDATTSTSVYHHHHKVLHMTGSTSRHGKQHQERSSTGSSHRYLIHFYAFLFYENYHTDLFIKRFIRDHLRYIDEIQCGAARIIEAIRTIARSKNHDDTSINGPSDQYDSFHIRRGDFQYEIMDLTAMEIYEGTTRDIVPDGRTVYIATDETNRTFFDVFHEHYNVVSLHNFTHLLPNINPNYYGMIDQLVASKGEVFVGTFYSTFSGYINRLRGYHAQKRQQLDGYEMGRINSYYYVPPSHAKFRTRMQNYTSVQQPYWQEEFPVAWRDINNDVTDDSIVAD